MSLLELLDRKKLNFTFIKDEVEAKEYLQFTQAYLLLSVFFALDEVIPEPTKYTPPQVTLSPLELEIIKDSFKRPNIDSCIYYSISILTENNFSFEDIHYKFIKENYKEPKNKRKFTHKFKR